MGWVLERLDDDGKTRYMARYRDLRGKTRSAGTFRSEREATRAWHKAEDDLAIGKVGDPRRGKQTFDTYVRTEWLPNHVIELTTREGYVGQLERYILPEFGPMRMIDILPSHVREWVVRMQRVLRKEPPTIRQCKVILDAILTTALNDQIVFLHAGKGVKTPPVAKRPKRIITVEQFDAIYRALGDETMRLLVETDIETGLRWGELAELRPKDIDFGSGVLTVARVVVQRRSKLAEGEAKFVVKQYPKDKEWRQLLLATHLLEKLKEHIASAGIGPDGLLFELAQPAESRRRTLPDHLPNPDELGWTEPNGGGHTYRHGTTSAYTAGRCRCNHCRNAIAFYRAARRSSGKDSPRRPRPICTDGHVGNDWFRRNVWNKATAVAQLPMKVTPHALRHTHASWLLAGGADLQVVKERLGHGSITTTEQYLHTLPGAGQAALTAMSAFRSGRGHGAKEKADQLGATHSPVELLSQLAQLRDSGVLGPAEFEAKKTELLARI